MTTFVNQANPALEVPNTLICIFIRNRNGFFFPIRLLSFVSVLLTRVYVIMHFMTYDCHVISTVPRWWILLIENNIKVISQTATVHAVLIVDG